MADKLIVSKSKVIGLFDAIRNKAGVTGDKTFEEMTDIVNALEIGTQEPEPVLISFTLTDRYDTTNTSYTLAAEEGMTWGEWVESYYNCILSLDIHLTTSGYVYASLGPGWAIKNADGINVASTETITASNYTYSSKPES